MKQFIVTNWYRLMTATAMIISAFAFFVFSLNNNVANAGAPHTQSNPSPANAWMVVKGNTVYEVTWDKSISKYKCNAVCNSLQ